MTEKEKMLSGKLYRAFDEELGVINKKSRLLLDEFNETSHTDFKKREEIIKKLFGSTKENVHINKPIYCDYGVNIHVGKNFYANFNTTFLDVNKIIIGDNVLFGPNVSVYTAGHPIDPIIRREGFEFGKEVNIGNDVWVGGSVVINPGVTIGDNVVIGAGSVVVKDIPSNSVAVGNPAKVIRKIDESDYLYWQKEKEEYYK